MKPNWLLIDANFLCYRNYYALRELVYRGRPIGVPYGFLRDIRQFQDYFATDKLLFCFDSRHSLRAEHCPTYKATRRAKLENATGDELEALEAFYQEISNLRKEYLHLIGFRNIFQAKGYESDDLIAQLCYDLPRDHTATIISSDKDLWQLLDENVHCYNPTTKVLLTKKLFEKQWGIDPHKWRIVRAIAGCDTDEVVGVRGVAEKTAAAYLRGELKPTSKAIASIQQNKELIVYNRLLVDLPFPETPSFKPKKDEVTNEGWNEAARAIGMKSQRDLAPFADVNLKGFGYNGEGQ